MKINFSKYHGTGNDFIIINNIKGEFSNLNREQIKKMCSRRFGIGADGLMLLNHHSEYDFEMIYYNSDGSGGTMCGNGGRCIAAFADKLGTADNEVNFIASDGEHKAFINKNGKVKLKMTDVSNIEKITDGYFCHTGSPHFVVFKDNIDNIDVFKEGREIRYSEEFKEQGTNVNFVEIKEENKLYIRTYERGVENETFSCGTGVIASSLVYSTLKNQTQGFCDITTKGGKLKAYFTKENNSFNDIWLEGPATLVFKGEIEDYTKNG